MTTDTETMTKFLVVQGFIIPVMANHLVEENTAHVELGQEDTSKVFEAGTMGLVFKEDFSSADEFTEELKQEFLNSPTVKAKTKVYDNEAKVETFLKENLKKPENPSEEKKDKVNV